jgi:hypothetical protein
LHCSGKLIRRGILGKPTLKQILDAQKRQVLVGKSYLNLAKGLLQADPAILQTAPTFFGLTTDGSMELAQMALARLYDETKGAVTVQAMLVQARRQASSFQRGDHQEVIAAIAKSEKTVLGLNLVLVAIRKRRNEWLAHLDPRTVADPKALSVKAKLTIPDLERAFKETEEILLELTSLYEGVIGDLRFIGGDDFEQALNWIRRAKCAFIENYEKQFGSWTGPRPKDCSRKPYDLI